MKNPVAWITNYAHTEGIAGPRWEVAQDDPSHAPTFTVTVECRGLRASGTADAKSAAKTAVANVVHNIFSAAVK